MHWYAWFVHSFSDKHVKTITTRVTPTRTTGTFDASTKDDIVDLDDAELSESGARSTFAGQGLGAIVYMFWIRG